MKRVLLITFLLPLIAPVLVRADDGRAVAEESTSEPAPERPESAAEAAIVSADANGFGVVAPESEFQLRVRGDVQADGRLIESEDLAPGTESFYVRRARLVLQGTMFGRFDFKIMPNFGMGRAELQDAYLDARFVPEFGLRAGKFKTPTGLEFLQSGPNLTFLERAYPSSVIPNRDVGVELHGELAGGRLEYSLGLFNGTIDGGSLDADFDNTKDVIGRVFTHPFRTSSGPLRGLGFGVAATMGSRESGATDPGLAAFRTSGRQTFFRYRSGDGGARADGTVQRMIPQGYWFVGPFGLMAEYALSRQDVRTDSVSGTLDHTAWQVTAELVLTGEKAGFGRLSPARPFDPARGQWGAFEISGRIQHLSVDEAAFPVFANPANAAQSAFSWGIGLSWYLNPSVRFMVNYEQTHFEALGEAGPIETERLVLTRFQLAF